MRASSTRRRRALAVVVPAVFAAGCTLVAGVDFEDARSAGDEAADASSDGPQQEPRASGDASSKSDSAPPSMPADGGDASPTSDASITDAGYDAPDCDQDNDGFLSSACGGDDCDDLDKRTHPDSGWVVDAPAPPRNGDWNCNGTVEKAWPTVWSACSSGALGCPQKSGFVADTPCGVSGTFKSCGVQNNACVLFVTYSPTQSCR